MKKIFVGIAVSALFVYLSLRGVNFAVLRESLQGIVFWQLLPFLFLTILMQGLRILRWGIIVEPLGKLDKLSLFAIANIGFLAIVALPARLGELMRPFLLSRRGDINLSAALGTIVMERILDGFAILAFALLSLFFIELPPWLVKGSVVFALLNGVLFLAVIIHIFREKGVKQKKGIHPILDKLRDLLDNFLAGFQIIKGRSKLFLVLSLSLLLWFVNVWAIYSLFTAFHLSLPPVAAVILMTVLIVGIAIPTAPGFIGNWHYACVLGLGLFGIEKSQALSFAVFYHILAVGVVVCLGLASLPFLHLDFSGLKRLMTALSR